MSIVRGARGISLVEVTIAVVLASVVMVGVVGFYISSQATWLDSSTKAVSQREATLALEQITSRVRGASSAIASPTPDANRMRLYLYDLGGNLQWMFWYVTADSTLHHGPSEAADRGPLMLSRVTRFRVSVTGNALVEVHDLDLLSPTGQIIELSTAAALYNRP